jgi:hypothetical protein
MTIKGSELKPGMFIENALVIEVNKEEDYIKYLSLNQDGDKLHRSSYLIFALTNIEVFKSNDIRKQKSIRMAFR